MNWKFGALAILFLVILSVIGWWWWTHTHGPGSECNTLAHEKTSGIDFSFTVDKVKSLQATLGLADKDVRDFDDLLRDYGAKYETICKDYSVLHVVTSAEYNCRRDNMDKTLDNVRALREVLGKSSSETTNNIAKQYITSVLDAAHAGFKSGCGASLQINPSKIRISHEIFHAFTILNIGNRIVRFGVSDLPQCLLPDPKGGELKQGDSVNVMLWRTYYGVPSDSFTFTVYDNFGNRLPVEVSGARTLPVPNEIAKKLKSDLGRTPTLEDALNFIEPDTGVVSGLTGKGRRRDTAGIYVTAAAILYGAGNSAGALEAIKTAESRDPTNHNITLQVGLLRLTSGDPSGALAQFHTAESDPDPRVANSSRWLSGVALSQTNNWDTAATYLCGTRGPANPDPAIAGLVEQKYGYTKKFLNAEGEESCPSMVYAAKPAPSPPDQNP